MICVKCHQGPTSVTNSRPHKKQASVWRRRRCVGCGFVFTTHEAPLADELLEIVYSDGTAARFSLPRLSINLHRFLTHHEEKAADEAYWLSETIYQALIKRGNSGQALPVHELLRAVHKVLERFDALAGLQYAAKYRLVTPVSKKPGRPRLK